MNVEWMDDAECRTPPVGVSRETWVNLFVRTKEVENPAYERSVYARARAVCERCPVIGECREYALARPEPHGMWGGLSPNQRKAIRSKRRLTKQRSVLVHGTNSGYQRHGCRCELCRGANREYQRQYRLRGRVAV